MLPRLAIRLDIFREALEDPCALLHRRQGDEPIGLQRQRHVLEGREVRGHRRQRHVFVTAPRNWSICGAIFGASIGMSLQYFDFS